MNQSTIAQGGGIANVPFLHENVFYSSVYINFGADSIHEEGSGKSAASSSTASQTGDSVHAVPADDQKCRAHLMSMLKETYERILIGNSQTGHTKFLEDIYSELTVVQNESGGVINEHEVMQIDLSSIRPLDEDIFIKCNDIFKVQPHTERRNRKVLTMGIAGVGKTVSVNKFILDWAKGKENQDIHFIFPLPFRVLNLKKAKKFSLIDLLNHYFFSSKPQLKSLPEDDGKVLFIFDGLDECHFPLYFEDEEEVKDVNEKASVGSLITSLINRNLLPFALIWVTSRPAAAHLMPREYINLVTEVRGFSDEQKEAYFTKYCNEDVAMKIFSHIKKSVSLYIMCQIPVFCWISATVLQPLMVQDSNKDIPSTLTAMYISFLLLQKNVMKKKYSEETTDAVNTEHIILRLGKLAFRNLESGTLNFYEDDLRKCGINVSEGTVFSGVCTQIFSQQEGVSERNIFSFVHLSVQESLAALYVHHSHCNKKRNVFQRKTLCSQRKWSNKSMTDLHKYAVEKALQSEKGHLDLFLRFLLGLSLEDNQHVLTELLQSLSLNTESVRDTADYIKKKLNDQMSSDRSMNLLHCLSELKDDSLTTEIQKYLNSGDLSTQTLSSTQWSALVYVLMMSEETQETFELKKYRASDEGLRRLLPVVKNTRRALLDHCNLSKDSCESLASVFSSDSPLKELDLSDNDLQDTGVKLLSAGLKSPYCKLEILRLSGCMITEKGCSSLASALSSNPSHLKELDLNYNHPGDSGMKLLSDRLETLRVEYGGKTRIKQGQKKYACELTLDPNTANSNLFLCEGNRKVVCVQEYQSYPDHPERFDWWEQVVCRESMSGRCYWEAEWSGSGADVALTYKTISRKGNSYSCNFGWNAMSWNLFCSHNSYSVRHNSIKTDLPLPPSSCKRVGVYVDLPAGTLSFYSVSDTDTLKHLHTFNTTFTQPLYAGFGVWDYDSSVYIYEIQ